MAPVYDGVTRSAGINELASQGKGHMARMYVSMLGGFAAVGPDGSPLALPTRKAEAVLALLLCRSGEAHPRERLIGLLVGRPRRQAGPPQPEPDI
jgi:hypothetical protein